MWDSAGHYYLPEKDSGDFLKHEMSRFLRPIRNMSAANRTAIGEQSPAGSRGQEFPKGTHKYYHRAVAGDTVGKPVLCDCGK